MVRHGISQGETRRGSPHWCDRSRTRRRMRVSCYAQPPGSADHITRIVQWEMSQARGESGVPSLRFAV